MAPPDDARVRCAEARDLPAVLGLLRRQLDEHDITLSPSELEHAVQALIDDPALGHVLVALLDGRVVGVYVDDACRGRGVGRELIEEVMRVAAARGCVALDLEVEAGHDAAERLYEHLGFHRHRRVRWLVEPRRGAAVLERPQERQHRDDRAGSTLPGRPGAGADRAVHARPRLRPARWRRLVTAVKGALPSAAPDGHPRAMRRISLTLIAALATLATLAVPGVTRAQMQCDGRFVENGATTSEVLALCGEPQQRTRSERLLSTGLLDSPGSEQVPIQIEEWTYSPPGQFTRKLIFESGRLVKTENGGYPDLQPEF